MLPRDFYVIADTHFFHDNIVKFCGRDMQIAMLEANGKPLRVVDHNEYMVKRWNAVVGPDDPILHLGDVFLWRNHGDRGYQERIAPRLNGKKYLILGNHDHDDHDWEALGYTVIGEFGQRINGKMVTFGHYPLWHDELKAKDKTNYRHVHGHIHNNGYPKAKGDKGWKEGSFPTAPNQINVSVEMIDYTPQRISALVK